MWVHFVWHKYFLRYKLSKFPNWKWDTLYIALTQSNHDRNFNGQFHSIIRGDYNHNPCKTIFCNNVKKIQFVLQIIPNQGATKGKNEEIFRFQSNNFPTLRDRWQRWIGEMEIFSRVIMSIKFLDKSSRIPTIMENLK